MLITHQSLERCLEVQGGDTVAESVILQNAQGSKLKVSRNDIHREDYAHGYVQSKPLECEQTGQTELQSVGTQSRRNAGTGVVNQGAMMFIITANHIGI